MTLADPSGGFPEAIGKALTAFKDLPLWILAGCAAACGLFLLAFGQEVTRATFVGFAFGLILFGCLTVARIVALSPAQVRAWQAWRDSKRFIHVTPSGPSWWHPAKQPDGSILTQIAIEAIVRNRTNEPIQLLGCKLVKPRLVGEVLNAHVFPFEAIPPQGGMRTSLHMMIRADPKWERGSVVKAIVALCDDEGREQRFKVEIKGDTPPPPKPGPAELVSSIADEIERAVVAVLQTELAAYERNGRSRGGLGSIKFDVGGKIYDSFGQETDNGGREAMLKSDGLDAILELYGRSKGEDQKRLVENLLARLDGQRGYLSVSYFIVAALIRLSQLPAALQKAESLPQDERISFGLSNSLMLLYAWIQRRPADFSDDDLDLIERLVNGVDEHPFRIPETVAEIRAQRIRNPAQLQ